MSRKNILLFAVPVVVLLLLPLLCFAVGYCLQDRFDFTLFLLTVVICWVMIPATIFGKPFFEPTDIGDQAHGFLGWLVVIVFYAVASLAISLLARTVMHMMSGRYLTRVTKSDRVKIIAASI
jgi:hypothetical protein